MATTPTMSSASQPRDRSFTGFAIPCRIGPYASAFARRSVSLYAMFLTDRQYQSRVSLHFSVQQQVRRFLFGKFRGFNHFFGQFAGRASVCRIREHGYHRFGLHKILE
jgi:hypothetical protein